MNYLKYIVKHSSLLRFIFSWMCPLHMEPFLDTYFLNTLSVSERLHLWREHARQPDVDTRAIALEFCRRARQSRIAAAAAAEHDAQRAASKQQEVPVVVCAHLKNHINNLFMNIFLWQLFTPIVTDYIS